MWEQKLVVVWLSAVGCDVGPGDGNFLRLQAAHAAGRPRSNVEKTGLLGSVARHERGGILFWQPGSSSIQSRVAICDPEVDHWDGSTIAGGSQI